MNSRFAAFGVVLAVSAVATVTAGGALPYRDSQPRPYTLTGGQARDVSATEQFIDRFNARELPAALALLAPAPQASDCDYRRVRAVVYRGRRAVANWLRQRFSDRDRLTLSRIFNENSAQPVGVVGVEFSRRTSTSLRRLGFPEGIRPRAAAKVVLTKAHHIAVFANAPGGGAQDLCRPSA